MHIATHNPPPIVLLYIKNDMNDMDDKNLTPEQKIIKLLAEHRLITDTSLIAPALADASIAEEIINKYEDIIPDCPESGECDHEPLTNEEIQVVFDNDEEQKKEA